LSFSNLDHYKNETVKLKIMSTNPTNHQIKNESTDRQTESNKDEIIKQLEQMQEMLFEKIRIKSNENEILKQSETNLIAKNNEYK